MQVKKFFVRALYFILLNLVVLFASFYIIHLFESKYNYHNWETDSDGLIIPHNQHKDLLLLGSSHARIFTRDKNHLRVENILQKNMLDIGKGGGEGGIITNLVMLKLFYARGNNTDQIVYFIDAWPFFTPKWNEKSYFLTTEPIDWDLFKICLHYNIDKDVLVNYFKSKYTLEWIERKPKTREINEDALKDVNPESIKKRMESLYIEPYDEKVFNHYAERLKEVVQLAQEHHTRLTFVFPSTLLDDNRGKDKVIALLEKFKSKYGTAWFDYSNAIRDYHYYYDHDHLNTKGVVLFTEQFLKPIVMGEK